MSLETPPLASRLDGIQILRGLAAMAVLVSHLMIIEGKYSPDQMMGSWASIGAAGVDLFFVISGFIMVYVTQDRLKPHNKPPGFLAGRAMRVYPLYWLISAALLLVWMHDPDMVFSSAPGDPDFVKSFALWPDMREPLLAVGWTLIHEMYFYIVFAIFLIFARRWLPILLMIWAVIILAALFNNVSPVRPETRLVLSPLTLEFILGAFTGLIFIGERGKRSGTILIIGIGLLIASVIAAHKMAGADILIPAVRVSYFAIPAALLTYGMAGLWGAGGRMRTRGVMLGDWSYALYLSHVLSLSLVGRLWSKFPRDGYIDNVVMIVVMVGFAVLVAGLLHRLFELPALRASKSALRKLRLRG